MVYDLFTSADYCYSKFSYLKLVTWFLGVMWLFWNINLFFFSENRLSSVMSSLIKWHYLNVKNESVNSLKGSYLVMSGLFVMILGSNVWGLFPYIFGVTTQVAFTFVLALMVWLCMVMSSMEFSVVSFLAHLTPTGSPMYLVPMLNLIELVSNLIRPLTLALRLSMNMTTGHILISLMSTSSVMSIFFFKMGFVGLVFLMMGYFLFEVGISLIQGFVFSLLAAQYLGEHT